MPDRVSRDLQAYQLRRGKNPRSEGVRIVTRPEDLPLGDEVVSYVLPLTYADPDEAVQTFIHGGACPMPNTAPSPPSRTHRSSSSPTTCPSFETSSTSPNTSMYPSAKVSRKFIKLERSDAERIVEILHEIITAQSAARAQRSRTTTATRRPPVPPLRASGSTGAFGSVNVTTGQLNEETVQVYADTRTNRILVIARPIELEYLEALIQEFDAPRTAGPSSATNSVPARPRLCGNRRGSLAHAGG